MKAITKSDKILLGIILIIFIASAISIVIISNTGNNNKKVIIKVQGIVIREIPLNKSDKSEIYKFNFNKNNGYIEIKNGSVRMIEMDRKICPRKICSDTGWISKGYQAIVCLPNKIVVSIESGKVESLDAIVE